MFNPFIDVFCLTEGNVSINYKHIQSIKKHHNEIFINLSSGKIHYLEMEKELLLQLIEEKRQNEILSVMKIELKQFNAGN